MYNTIYINYAIPNNQFLLADAYIHELGENECAGRDPGCGRRAPLGTGTSYQNLNPESLIGNPQSPIGNPQSRIRNPINPSIVESRIPDPAG
jgi:hypothetical protein